MATRRKGAGRVGAGGGGGPFTMQEVRELVKMLQGSEVTDLVWARGDQKLVLRRGHASDPASAPGAHPGTVGSGTPAPAPAGGYGPGALSQGDASGTVVTSPFVGTFYRAPSPDAPPYVEVGSEVKRGQVLCIVEAMKLMNEIEAEVEGRVAEIYVANSTPVEFGQPLLRIEPAE
jgi:acetyl-CoA carboxylase biotin carboxyl carrier protein